MTVLKQLNQHKITALILAIFAVQVIFPQYSPVFAATSMEESVLLPNMVIRSSEPNFNIDSLEDPYVVVKTYNIPITAYSSTVDQTDSTPCITANGYDLCAHNQENVIAANFLPFGTKVRIPEHFGDRIFTVQDRMNSRYYYRADIWMRNRPDAVKWGLKYTTIEVVEEVSQESADEQLASI